MKNILTTIPALLFCLMTATTSTATTDNKGDKSWLIENVVIVDGTGAEGFRGAVRVSGGIIVDMGDIQATDYETVIDGNGQVLAPGFIDTHSHADAEIREQRDALAAVSQGITTVVIGQDARDLG